MPRCLLLLPRTLDGFILRDQAEDLLRCAQVEAVGPPRVPYGAQGRLPAVAGKALAREQARRMLATRDDVRVVVIFHPLQLPLAEALIETTGAELWYARWDRYERALDAGPALRKRLEALHARAATRAALTFAASGELVRLEAEAGRPAALLVPLAADRFPAPSPEGTVVAVSLGHHGHRVDWALLRGVAERLGDRLVLLLVGASHPGELAEDPDFAACQELPQLVWLGHRSDAEAAALILCADVGIVPFKVEPFNDAGLPYRILKYARLGRRTVAPPLAGTRTWSRAVTEADGPEAFAAALLEHAGARTHPDADLRAWALAQTAAIQDAPLWSRLRTLGFDV